MEKEKISFCETIQTSPSRLGGKPFTIHKGTCDECINKKMKKKFNLVGIEPNKNYIDEIMEELNKKDFISVKQVNEFFKQKLQQTQHQERERIKDKFALMKHYTGGSSVEPKDLRINLKEAIDIINEIKNND